jgi:thioredoxin 1
MADVMELTDETFENEVIKSDLPVLVDFSATWCYPCKVLAPIVDEIAGDFKGRLKVVKMDVDSAQATASRLGILSVPTLMVFRQGKEVGRTMGAQPKAAIVKQLESILA